MLKAEGRKFAISLGSCQLLVINSGLVQASMLRAEGRRKKEERRKLQKFLRYKGYRTSTSQEKSTAQDLGLYHKFYDDRQNLKTLLPPAFCLKTRNLSSSPKVDKNLSLGLFAQRLAEKPTLIARHQIKYFGVGLQPLLQTPGDAARSKILVGVQSWQRVGIRIPRSEEHTV